MSTAGTMSMSTVGYQQHQNTAVRQQQQHLLQQQQQQQQQLVYVSAPVPAQQMMPQGSMMQQGELWRMILD
jgi:hypothetical protein